MCIPKIYLLKKNSHTFPYVIFNYSSYSLQTMIQDNLVSGARPGIRKGGGAKSESLFILFSIFSGGGGSSKNSWTRA